MNWLNKLLSPPEQSAPPGRAPGKAAKSAPATPPAAPDPALARRALAGADSEDERRTAMVALGTALAQNRIAPEAGDAPEVWTSAICLAPDRALALDWLSKVEGLDWLAEIARSARFAEVRLAAVQRIEDPVTLEQIAGHSRNRDKGVYRHCTEVLQDRRRADFRVHQAENLATALRALLAAEPLSVSRLLELERAVHALGNAPQVLAPCIPLLEQANARVLADAQELRRLQALASATDALRGELGESGAELATSLPQWHSRAADLARELAELPGWVRSQAGARAITAGLASIEQRLAHLAKEDEAQQAAAQQRALALAAPTPQAPAPPPPKTKAPEPADAETVSALLEELESALEEGHLALADDISRKIKEHTTSRSVGPALDARLQRMHGRLADLHGWAKWGAARKREDLLAAAENLLASEHGVEELAVAIPALREQWKQLNSQGPSIKSLWERFDAALTKAYQPVALQRAAEAAQRAQVRAAKEAMLVQWESALAAVDASPADLEALQVLREQIREQWRAAPLAGFRDERMLRKRLDALTHVMDQRLEAARTAEMQRREQLLAAAQALATEPDLRKATSACKALQEQWRSAAGAPRLPRGVEQKLWKRFRAACDAVFGRREALRAQEEAQREERKKARSALLGALDQIIAADDAQAIKQALVQFRADWEGSPRGTGVDELDRRARELVAQGQRRIDALRQGSYRSRLELLASKTPPLDGLDQEALTSGRQQRDALLLDMEMALEIPSPAPFQDARRRRQLERLQRHFRAHEAQRTPVETLLEQMHAIAAAPDPEQERRIAAIVRKLVESNAAKSR